MNRAAVVMRKRRKLSSVQESSESISEVVSKGMSAVVEVMVYCLIEDILERAEEFEESCLELSYIKVGERGLDSYYNSEEELRRRAGVEDDE